MFPSRPALDPHVLTQSVVWGGLVLGLALGAVGQSTRFCVRGAIADWVQLRAPGRLVSWLLAIAVGAIAVQALVSAGALDARQTLAWNPRLPWLSYLVGGLLFGYGMILAGGCPQRCLVKAGAGNLKAAAALVLAAIAAIMTLRGAFAPLRANYLDAIAASLPGPQDIGSVVGRGLGIAPGLVRWLAVAAIAAGVFPLAWRLRRAVSRAQWIGGIAVGLLLGAAFLLTGFFGYIAENPETLEPGWLGTQSHRPEGFSFVAPLGHALDLLTLWTDRATVATFGVMLALGVLVGSFASAKWRGDFKLEAFKTPREMGAHALGALLMGFGGVTALGCSIGNGVTGLALLSCGSALATAGICAGAWLALQRQGRSQAAAGRVMATAR